MAYVALYRRWRPESFADLVGQEHISRTLSRAVTSGQTSHAYLFTGPRGTGKTSTAKIFAKAINCEKGPTPEPCGVCAACRAIREGNSPDVYEIDAASTRFANYETAFAMRQAVSAIASTSSMKCIC